MLKHPPRKHGYFVSIQFESVSCQMYRCRTARIETLLFQFCLILTELGTANLHSILPPQIPQNCKRCSATANPQVCDRFAVTFRTSAIANGHCTSANLDYIIYCYFVLVITFFTFGGQILPSIRNQPRSSTQKTRASTPSKRFYRGTGNIVCCFADLR